MDEKNAAPFAGAQGILHDKRGGWRLIFGMGAWDCPFTGGICLCTNGGGP